jgi:hypothetical protein
MDGQPVLAEAFRQDLHNALGVAVIAKPNHEIVRKADEEGTMTQPRLLWMAARKWAILAAS